MVTQFGCDANAIGKYVAKRASEGPARVSTVAKFATTAVADIHKGEQQRHDRPDAHGLGERPKGKGRHDCVNYPYDQ